MSNLYRGLRYIALVALIIIILGSLSLVFAQGTATVSVNPEGIPSPVEVGQVFDFEIEYTCSSSVSDCDRSAIEVVIPTDVVDAGNFILVDDPNGRYEAVGLTTRTNTDDPANPYSETVLTLSNTAGANPCIPGGTATQQARCLTAGLQAELTVRVGIADEADTFGTDFPLSLISINPDDGNSAEPPVTTTVTITPPIFDWEITKTRVFPGTVAPTPDDNLSASYNIVFTPESLGNFNLDSFVITDTLPPNAVMVGASIAPDQALPATGTITWTFGAREFSDGPLTIRVDVAYPPASFVGGDPAIDGDGTVVDNQASFTANYRNGTENGVCGTPCAQDELDQPTTTVSLSKGLVQGPIGVTGQGRFNLNVSTVGSNTYVEDVVIVDVLQDQNVAPNTASTADLFQFIGVRLGSWSDGTTYSNLTANVSYSTERTRADCINPAGNTTLVTGHDGSTSNIVNIPIANATCIRIDFQFNDLNGVLRDGLPPDFSFTGSNQPFQSVFEPIESGFQPTGSEPLPYDAQRVNCLDADYRDSSGNLVASSQACDNDVVDVISDNNSNESISGTKQVSPSTIRPESPLRDDSTEYVTFTVRVNITERTSDGAEIDELIIADALPEEFDPATLEVTGLTITDDFNTLGGTLTAPNRITDLMDINNPARDNSAQYDYYTEVRNQDWDGDTDTEDRTVMIFRFGGDSGTANEMNYSPADNQNQRVEITFRVILRRYIPEGSYSNQAIIYVDDSANLVCEGNNNGNNATPDSLDVDNDGNTTENVCEIDRSYSVPTTLVVDGQKWIRNETRFDAADPSNFTDIDSDTNPGPVPSNSSVTSCPLVIGINNTINGLSDSGSGNLTNEQYYNRFGCVSEGIVGDQITYRLTVQNYGNDYAVNYALYDLLPHEGDVGVSQVEFNNGGSRGSSWRTIIDPAYVAGNPNYVAGVPIELVGINNESDPVLADLLSSGVPPGYTVVTPANWQSAFTIEYNNTFTPCRAEVYPSLTSCDNTWTSTPSINTRSFRIRLNPNFAIAPGAQLDFVVRARIPSSSNYVTAPNTDFPTNAADIQNVPHTGTIAWNNYAHAAAPASDPSDALDGVDVIKVGIRIPEFVSVGNRLWYDLNNNRRYNPGAGETPIENAVVSLYTWNGTDVGALVAQTTTDADGYYIFNLDPPGLDLTPNPEYINNGQYVVVVEASNFADPTILQNYVSSTGSQGTNFNNNDTRDRGVDTFIVGGLADGGIRSEVFTINTSMGSNEDDPNPNSADDPNSTTDDPNNPNDDAGKGGEFGPEGRGNLGQDDNNSNLRVDFGFTLPMSIGNRIWLDDGGESNGTYTQANKNNGVFDAGESPIEGVTVELYEDTNNNGVYDAGTDQLVQLLNTTTGNYDIPARVTTDTNGYYLFSPLLPDDYFVHIPASNFTVDLADPTNNAVLALHVSSTGWTTQQQDITTVNPTFVDNNDNGVDTTTLTTDGITSERIRLTLGAEPTTEADKKAVSSPPNADEGDGYLSTQAILPENSDLTVDFGFLLPPMSIGNVVWQDANNNGIRDGIGTATEEVGIENVRVNLYRDSNGDGNPDDVNGSGGFDAGDILAFTTTDANGYYLFDGYVSTFNADVSTADRDLPAGRYIIEIDPSNFNTGNALSLYFSSDDPATIGDDNTDSNDDGIGADANYPYDGGAGTARLQSASAILVPYGEPTNETDDAGVTMPNHGTSQTAYGISTDGSQSTASTAIADNQSDRTWDFGFYQKFSVGNRVWYDMDASSPNARPGDGRFSADGTGSDDAGVNGVVVELYLATQTAGVDIPVARTTTDANGYYLFDETNTLDPTTGNDDPNNTPISAGTYFVHIPASEFGVGEPLHLYNSSDGGGIPDGANEWDDPEETDNNIDTDDNGNNPADPATTGVSSNAFTLSYQAEPTNNSGAGNTTDVVVGEERDFNPSPTDRDGDGIDADDDVYGVGVQDNNNNMTIDFAFYRAMSIGNRVWFDQDRSGTINNNYLGVDENATNGIDGVRLFLFRADSAGNALNPDGTAGGSFTDDAGGNGIPDDAIAVDTTANGGYYLFDSWITGGFDAGGAEQLIPPGYYVVVVDPAEFAGGELQDYISTITNVQANGSPDAANSDNQRDSDDNGIDTEDNGALARTDVRSGAIHLVTNTEASPTNTPDDTDLDTSIPDATPSNREGTGITDSNGEMTVDFGFFIPYAIGNRVWLDDPTTNSSQIHPDGDNNGQPDGPEATAGLPNVQLSLFLVPAGYTVGDSPIDATGATTSFIVDADNNGIPDGAFATTLTNANGYYIFDYLPEGNYVVQVDPLNFSANTGTTTNAGGALYDAPNMFPYFSSEDTDTSFIPANNDTDLRDDGIDENNPQTNGVRSNRYTLSRNAEPSTTVPTDDRDLDATAGEGTNGELDANANMTVDFEFNAAIPMSIGNRVFYDYNNNGIFDGTDVGVQGVIVRLYSVDAAGNVVGGGQIDDPSDALRQVTTGANGEYIFDGLQRGTYRVVLAEENFRNGALLDNYQSSTNVNGNLVDNNGDSADVTGFENGGSVTVGSQADNLNPENQGIISPIITLTPGTEPQNETFKFDTDTPADGIPDDGQPNVEDSNGDMTQDFGVYKPQSIGNRVWFDTNNDGLISTGENGVANVTVSLYLDEGNGVYDGTEALAQLADITTRTVVPAQEQTDANGYYLFDNVPPGQYFVVIEDTNFATGQPLAGVSSTTTGVDNPSFTPPAGFSNPDDDDSNDNGVDTPVAGDIHSELIDLTRPYDDLITTEPDLSNNATNDGPSNIGRNGETDNNSDLTIDFGFTSPNMSLGNRVWYDEDGNGVIDTNNRFGNDESAGIDGVNVSLYRDNDGNGTPDGAAIALDTTGNGGYYLFENLAPGRYVVGIDNSNFNAGNPLNGLISTLTTTDNPADDPTTDPNTGATFVNPDDDDSNDNGRDVRNTTYGVLSNTVTLTRDSERSGETDTEAGVGNGTGVDADDSDLTVDFGFFEPMSLGNRVWLDNDDSGLIDNAEVGVSGVTVYLFRTDGAGNIIDADGDGTGSTTDDTNGDNIPDDAIDSDVTDAGGYYLFDGLPPGTYIIAVDGQAFGTGQPLAGTASSTTDGVPTVDSDDDGITVDANGNVLSAEITLNTRDSGINEPTGETDLSNSAGDGPNRRGNNGETDANSNLAVDFGFTPTAFYSIGNRVWLDNGGGTPANARNGFFDVGETGIQGVAVSLYRDANGDNIPDGAAIDTTTTDANGYYLFDGLATGTYIVGLNRSNFIGTGVLVGHASTIPNADNGSGTPEAQDNNDNRNNPAVGNALDPTYGFYSLGYTLDGTEPTGETSPDNTTGSPDDTGTDPASNAIADTNSDLTIDFGVYRSMTIGNRVWFDLNNNGLADTGENGIAGVELVLFLDANADGIPDDLDGSTTFGDDGDILTDNAGNPYTDITDSRGYYLFNNLAPNNYIVAVRDTNFTAGNILNGFSSSTGTFATPPDRSDNGVDTPTNGHIISETIRLTLNGAPTGETDNSGNTNDGPNFRGVNNETDNNSDLTWDFGFFSQPMSIGNRVWLDDGGASVGSLTPANAGNGVFDTDEVGIANVIVELFADSNNDGAPDGSRIATDTTDANGYYLFDGLAPGRYIVRIAPSNFNAGNALDGLFSTTTINTADTDENDNGIDSTNPETSGILSESILLESTSSEPIGESDLSNDAGDDDGSGNYRGANGEADEDSNLTIDFGFTTAFDWGDAPDTYGTDATDSGGEGVGPSHRIITQLRLGNTIDDEVEGFPVVDVDNPPDDPANGDDTDGTDDEDGLSFPPTIVPETTFDLEVSVFNNTGRPANLVVWFDWDGDGIFEVSSDVNGDGTATPEAVTEVVPSSPRQQTIIIPVTVPAEADIATDGTTYVRARLTTDSLSASDPTGSRNDGEVEDYELAVSPPGVFISKSDGVNAIVAGQSTTYTVIIENSASAPNLLNQLFTDDVPVANPNGFVESSVSWTCTASGGASCVAGSVVTSRSSADSPNNPWEISERVDLPSGGRLEYRITATLRAAATGVGGITIDNTAEIASVSDTDSNSIVFDPPRGVKTGTLLSDTVLRWEMVWFNSGDGNPATNNRQLVTITDTIQAPQTFLGNLECTAFDSNPASNGAGGVGTETISCTESGGTVTWTGYIDEDFGTAGGDNRLVIGFDVTIPGDGTYNNVAELDDGDPATSNVVASATVVVDDGVANNPNNDETIITADPVIVKLVDPLLALPNEDVTWTISVTNPNSFTLNDIVVVDDIPAELEIISASASFGTPTVSGQTVRYEVQSLLPDQTVTMTIVTRIRSSVTSEQIINIAILENTLTEAAATVFPVYDLPETGETPWWRSWFAIGSLGASVFVLLTLVGWRKRTTA